MRSMPSFCSHAPNPISSSPRQPQPQPSVAVRPSNQVYAADSTLSHRKLVICASSTDVSHPPRAVRFELGNTPGSDTPLRLLFFRLLLFPPPGFSSFPNASVLDTPSTYEHAQRARHSLRFLSGSRTQSYLLWACHHLQPAGLEPRTAIRTVLILLFRPAVFLQPPTSLQCLPS